MRLFAELDWRVAPSRPQRVALPEGCLFQIPCPTDCPPVSPCSSRPQEQFSVVQLGRTLGCLWTSTVYGCP